MFSSAITNSQVNNNNNVVIDSGNTLNIDNTSNVQNTLNIENMVLSGIQDRDLQSLQQPLTAVKNNVREISERLEDNKRFEILKWLSTVDYKQHHDYIHSARQANTGNWLFRKQHFLQWNNASSSIFWLHGIAGAGKTMLASSVIDIPRPTNHAVAYFYCKYGEIDRQEPQSILSTIVKQLSLLSPDGFLPKAVISHYEEQKKDGVDSRRLGLDKSVELIHRLSKAFEQTVIIIDALDECNKEKRYNLLVALKKLRSSTKGLKIFLASRNDDDIRIELENEAEVYIQPSDNSDDIELFVVAEVEKYISTKRLLGGEVRPELKRAIIETLIKGADGMFLWVRLQIEHIRMERSEKAIRVALQSLPKDLEATYSVIWDRIQADTQENCCLAERTLKWIICAKRPLRIREITEAVSIAPMQWAEKPHDDNITHETLLHLCQNLVVLDKELDVLRTAHFSVTEFLLTTITHIEAHTAAAEFCLTLLCCENHINTSRQSEGGVLENYASREYLMENWAEHVRLSGDGSSTLMALQRMFFEPSNSPAFSKWLLAASKSNKDLQSKDVERQLNPIWVACYFQLWGIFKYLLGANPVCTMRNYYGRKPIHLIAQHGYSTGVELILEQKGVNLNTKDDMGRTPLHWAASEGHDEVIRLIILQKGRNPIFWRLRQYLNLRDENGFTPLCAAAYGGHEDVVRLLLQQKGVDLKAKTKDDRTLLHAAALGGNETVVTLLLQQKDVDLNAKTNDGTTLLHAAALGGSVAVLRLLLEQKGLDFNAKTNDGRTLLHAAASGGDEAVARLLLEKEGVDLNAKDKIGRTPLHAAASEGHEAVVRLLLEQKGVDLNAKDKIGRTPLYAAASKGHEAVARLLLEQKGVDLNAKDNDGRTPLYIAASMGHEAVVRLLLQQKGVDLNAKDNDGWTPLYAAASMGHEAVVRLLLQQKGVDLNAKDNHGWTPLYAAASMSHEAVVRLLLQQKGVDLNAKDKIGRTPLHAAASKGHEAVVRLLLEQKGVDLNAKDKIGRTPLYAAASKGHEAVARLLLEQKGVDLNAKGSYGRTPLYIAASMGHEAVVRLLLQQKGVDLNAKDNDGRTPLYIAAWMGHEAVVRLLLEQKGVDLNAKNNSRNTPRDEAAMYGRTKIVKLLDDAMEAREGNTSGRR